MSASQARSVASVGLPSIRVVEIDLVDARVSSKTVWSFLRIRGADSEEGVGEASLMSDPGSLAMVLPAFRQQMLGQPLAAALRCALDTPRPTMAHAALASAFEQAHWDLAGRVLGRSAVDLLDHPRHAQVPLYANINRRTIDRSPAAVAKSAQEAARAAYTRFKFAPFDGLTPAIADSVEGIAKIDDGIARIAAMREALGPSADIYVDCHWRFSPRSAVRAIEALEALGVSWFECPLVEDASNVRDIAALRRTANRHGMRLAGLEALRGRDAFAPWLAAAAYDVVMPDVKYCGGMAELLDIAADADRQGVQCAPHNPSGPVSHAASVIAAAHLPGAVLLEHQWDETPWFYDLVGDSLPRPVDGITRVPDAPGLGTRLVAQPAG